MKGLVQNYTQHVKFLFVFYYQFQENTWGREKNIKCGYQVDASIITEMPCNNAADVWKRTRSWICGKVDFHLYPENNSSDRTFVMERIYLLGIDIVVFLRLWHLIFPCLIKGEGLKNITEKKERNSAFNLFPLQYFLSYQGQILWLKPQLI